MQQYERNAVRRIEIEREQFHRLQMAEAAYFKGERRGELGLDEWLQTEWSISPDQCGAKRTDDPIVTCYIESSAGQAPDSADQR